MWMRSLVFALCVLGGPSAALLSRVEAQTRTVGITLLQGAGFSETRLDPKTRRPIPVLAWLPDGTCVPGCNLALTGNVNGINQVTVRLLRPREYCMLPRRSTGYPWTMPVARELRLDLSKAWPSFTPGRYEGPFQFEVVLTAPGERVVATSGRFYLKPPARPDPDVETGCTG